MPAASGLKLLDLPDELLERIVATIASPNPPPPIRPLLGDACRPYQPLGEDLLSVAVTHPNLHTSVVKGLGPRARFLTRAVTGNKLAQFVSALADHLVALSFLDPTVTKALFYLGSYVRGGRTAALDEYLQDLIVQSECVLTALASRNVALQVLDLSGVPFGHFKERELGRLTPALVNALRSSSHSLRELGLEGCQECTDAVKAVPLPQLQVLALNGCPLYYDGMIGALARRSRVTEIRFKKPVFANYLRNSACTQVCAGVTHLRMLHNHRGSDEDFIAFLALFPLLKVLHWQIMGNETRIRNVRNACRTLEELHVWPWDKPHDFWNFMQPHVMNEVPRIVKIRKGKLRRLAAVSLMTSKFSDAVARDGTELRHLGVLVNLRSPQLLSSVLAQCRKIRRLDLLLCRQEQGLDPDSPTDRILHVRDWQALWRELEIASTELCEISVRCTSTYVPRALEQEEAAFEALSSCAISLGKRLKVLHISVPMHAIHFGIAVPRLTRLVNIASKHNLGLEELALVLHTVGVLWSNGGEKEAKYAELKRAMARLKRAAPGLHYLFLGGAEAIADTN